ncbi:hypothetical protein KC865_04810 [Candidatus Kaiserbacteria bacterium]|nr:hypothetical protein [Candidatus Kaiserbacteria bacterium]USN92273.1 MAG: hypothetical protein H6782_00400 [Candidatus Nomurabacteria bacterium]
MRSAGLLKIIAGIFLCTNALEQIFSHQTWWFIQNVNLIFHEAGHFIFMFFGKFMAVLGGSLLEILVPTIVIFSFWRTRQYFSATFGCWWLATALLSVSVYASDAQEKMLPLLGGKHVVHDWSFLLTQLGLLKYDNLVGYVFWLGSILAIVWSLYFLTRDRGVASLFKKTD